MYPSICIISLALSIQHLACSDSTRPSRCRTCPTRRGSFCYSPLVVLLLVCSGCFTYARNTLLRTLSWYVCQVWGRHQYECVTSIIYIVYKVRQKKAACSTIFGFSITQVAVPVQSRASTEHSQTRPSSKHTTSISTL